MSVFSVDIGDTAIEVEGDVVLVGSMRIGDFNESFHASLSYWDRGDYISQWKEALNRLLRGERNSAIVTSMYDPRAANFVFWWVMYLIEGVVHIQNHVLFLDKLGRQFDEADLYSFIPERETHTEEGGSISEWMIGVSAIGECIGTM